MEIAEIPLNVCFLAGEASGDLHGAGVVASLRRLIPDAACWGMAGPSMESAGCEVVVDQREMAVMGFAEVISHLGVIRRNEAKLLEEVRRRKPDVVVTIDYPGFNLRFAKLLRQQKLAPPTRILGYISPQVWAWKAGRIPVIAERYDGLAVVFPFEVETYRKVSLDVRFVGHPLLEELPDPSGKSSAREKLNIKFHPVLALLPGSRKQEILRHVSILADTAKLLKEEDPNLTILVPTLGHLPKAWYQPLVELGSRLIIDDATTAILAADAAVVASGTATLQTALLGTPQVVLYRTSPISYAIGKRIVKVPYIALANLAMGEKIVDERIQHEATPQIIAKDVTALLGENGRKQVARFASLRDHLGGSRASERVAEWIIELAKPVGTHR